MFVGSGAHNPHGLSSLESRHFPPRISLCQLCSFCHCSSLQRDVDFFFFFFVLLLIRERGWKEMREREGEGRRQRQRGGERQRESEGLGKRERQSVCVTMAAV